MMLNELNDEWLFKTGVVLNLGDLSCVGVTET